MLPLTVRLGYIELLVTREEDESAQKGDSGECASVGAKSGKVEEEDVGGEEYTALIGIAEVREGFLLRAWRRDYEGQMWTSVTE